jgi:xylulokinase
VSVIGLDLGTTACKAIAVNDVGEIISKSMLEYKPVKTQSGYIELNPKNVWNSVKKVLIKVSEDTRKKDPVKAISISAMGDTVSPFNENIEPTYNSILAFDTRSTAEADFLEISLGKEWIFKITGMPVHTSYSASKILWVKRNLPNVFKKTDKFLCYEDYIFTKLGLEKPAISYSCAGRTMLFDIQKKKWNEKILSVCGISNDYLATPQPSGKIIGKINEDVAKEIGFSKNTNLVIGGHDQVCGALGGGVIKEGSVLDATGTVECLVVVFDHALFDNNMLETDLCCYPHCYPEKYCSIGIVYTSGAAFRWFRDKFGFQDCLEADKTNKDVYDIITSKFSYEPTNILLIPHLSGSGTPSMNPKAKGSMFGITLSTDKYDIGKAILEGNTFELKLNIDIMESIGIPINEIKCIGGGARSDFWLQLKADILGRKVIASEFVDAPAVGAAILAGYGIGIFSSLEEGIEATSTPNKIYTPNAKREEVYKTKYEEYMKFRERISSLYQ